jgi:hypothetical protein
MAIQPSIVTRDMDKIAAPTGKLVRIGCGDFETCPPDCR